MPSLRDKILAQAEKRAAELEKVEVKVIEKKLKVKK